MEENNAPHIREGNQINIAKNKGEIHIHNHPTSGHDFKQLSEHLNASFGRMEKYFNENRFQIFPKKKKRK